MVRKSLIKNGKYFLPSQRDGSDFKELFKRLASAGAGRPVDEDGFPQGPWTADLLADAISQIDANGNGVDLRTVQLWFQDNEKGISSDNIRWLARIFGCDDPDTTSEWQADLSAAQTRLAAKRREGRKNVEADAQLNVDLTRQSTLHDEAANVERVNVALEPKQRFSLVRRSEAFFGRGSHLDLPASVFAGAVALGFLSYFLGIHSISYSQADGSLKQVGFIWAPNWTILFMAFLPLFLAFVVELVVFWKNEGRSRLLALANLTEKANGWTRRVEASSYTYWSVFLICLAFAGLFQWIGVRLIPLLRGDANYATDWGSLAIIHPEIISVPEAATFTGLAYLYMCLYFYLFFVGLILLYTIAHDLWKIGEANGLTSNETNQSEVNEICLKVMQGIFRCTVLGILIAVCMKLQSIYLTTAAENIVAWLLGDFSSVFRGQQGINDGTNFSMPTHYSSLLIATATCFVFVYSSIRLGDGTKFHVPLGKMPAIVGLLVAGYLSIGAFAGFTMLLCPAVLLAIYGLYYPGLGTRQTRELKDNENVS